MRKKQFNLLINAQKSEKSTKYKNHSQGDPKNAQYKKNMTQQQKNNSIFGRSENIKVAKYNKHIVGSKTLNKTTRQFPSKFLIKRVFDFVLAFDDILTTKLNNQKQKPQTFRQIIIKDGEELRLGLQWQMVCDLQACSQPQKSAVIQKAQSSHHQKNNSLKQIQQKSQKITKTINISSLAQWFIDKLFKNSRQTYLLINQGKINQQQSKSVTSFLKRIGLPCIQISHHQFLVFRPAIGSEVYMKQESKQCDDFDLFFGEIFNSMVNVKIKELSNKQLSQIKVLLSKNQKQGNLSTFLQQPQKRNARQGLELCISKQNQSKAQKFIENPLEHYNHLEICHFRALRCSELSNNRIDQDMQIFNFNMPKYEEYDLKATLKEVNDNLRKKGFFSMKSVWKKWLKQKIQHIIKNIQIYQEEIREELYVFVRLHEFHLLKIQQYLQKSNVGKIKVSQKAKLIYEIIYPDIVGLLNSIYAKLSVQTLRQLKQVYIRNEQNLNMNQNQLEISFIKLTQQQLQHEKSSQQEKLFILRAIELLKSKNQAIQSELSSKIQKFTIQSQKNNLSEQFLALDSLLYYDQLQQNEQQVKQLQGKCSYLQNIENQKSVNSRCLGCSRFFYQNLNIYESNLTKVPLKVFDNIERLNENNAQLVDTICGMLNSEGGIILFDCERKYTSINICGRKISQKQKQQIQHKLIPIMNFFHPKIEAKEVSLSFVPVYQNPQKLKKETKSISKWINYQGDEASIKLNQSFIERSPISGHFVGRIIIRPTDLTKAYIYSFQKQNHNPAFYSDTFQHGSHVKLPMHTLRKYLRQKIRNHHFSDQQQLSEFQLSLLKKASIIDHKCDIPQIGSQISNNYRTYRGIEHQNNSFQQLTMVFYTPNKSKQCKDLLQKKLRGLKFIIKENQFPKYKFFSQSNILYLFHAQKFQLYFDRLKQFQQKNQIHLVNVVQSLKIRDFPSQLKQKLKASFQGQFLHENLQLFEYSIVNSSRIQESSAYYLSTNTKKAIVFLYLYLKDRLKKSSQIKFPDKYDQNYNQIEYIKREIDLNKHNQQSQIHLQINQFAMEWNQIIHHFGHRNNKKRGKF